MEEHLGALRESLGLSHPQLMDLGREYAGQSARRILSDGAGSQTFPARQRRLGAARRSIQGYVDRTISGRPEEAVPIGHITNGVHVPTWLAPQMFRLYDRHLGNGWHEHSGESRIWEGIENVDDGEVWETHLSLKLRLLEFVRRRAME